MENPTNTVLLPSAYLPSVSWFYYLYNFEKVFIEQYETYPKQTYRNRCKILAGNGPLDMTIPVSKPSGNKTITKEVVIFDDKRWQQNHWQTICSAYLNSPFFEYYRDEFEPFFQNSQSSLLELNLRLTSLLCEIIGIEKEIKRTETFIHSPQNSIDLRSSLSPKNKTEGLIFPEYIQVFSARFDFIPDLCILDVIFNLGPETLDYLQTVNRK